MRGLRFVLTFGVAAVLVAAAAGGGAARTPSSAATVRPVPSLTPAATLKEWRRLVRRARLHSFSTTADCRPLRAVFYAATDWLRLATKLAANASPCAHYYISVPPLVGDKTQPRGDQAWRIRALGPNFHALSEVHMGAWGNWVSTNGSNWYAAGVEARRRMALMGYDVALGDSWVVNELSSAVRRGDGVARLNVREFVRGLHDGDGSAPSARGAVFITGMAQSTGELSVYQARLQDWYEDGAFWTDMSAYVSEWSQELYGDVRNYAVPGAPLAARRDALNAYLQHEIALARVAPEAAAAARTYLERAYHPLANAAWSWDAAFGWTAVPVDLMKHYVSAQVYALRNFAAQGEQDRFGFAWAPKNLSAVDATTFANETANLLDRLGEAIRDSATPVDPADPGVGACGPLGQNLWCAGDLDGAAFNAGWQTFSAWKPSVVAFATAPQSLEAGVVSPPLAVEYRTYSGIPLTTTASSPVTVTLASSSPGGAFALAPAGSWTPTLTAAIPTGSGQLVFHYRDTTAGTPTITASAPGKRSSVQTHSVAPGPLARVVISPPSAMLEPGASQPFEAATTDAYGNAVAASISWSLAAGTPGSLTASGSSAVFTAGSTGGSGSVVATAATATASASAGAAVEVVGPRVASVSYALSWRDLYVTVSLVDAAGNPLPGTAVGLTVYRNGYAYASRSGTTGADGRLTVVLSKTHGGCYSTTVTGVGAPGWDGTTPPNRYCRD